MDASQITKLHQKQNTRYINRSQTVDSSTLIWKNTIESSKYIKGIKACDGEQNCNVPTNPACSDGNGICSFGGSGRTTSIQTGSPKQFLNVLSGASGSGSEVYSSERITLHRAGANSCGVAGTSPAPKNSYVVLPGGDPLTSDSQLQVPSCSYLCTNTNGPVNGEDVPINNNLNPYLPQFDTYYKFKNPSAQCQYPIQDQNQKHFVKECHTRFPNANNGENVLCKPCDNTTYLDPTTKQFQTNIFVNGPRPPTCDGCILEPHVPSVSPELNEPEPTVPQGINIISVTPGDEMATVVFETPDDGGLPILGYKYSLDSDNDNDFQLLTLTRSLNTATFTNLENGKTYTIRLRAFNSKGDGIKTSFEVTPTTIPEQPTITNAIRGNQQITIEFQTPSDDGGSQITGYKYKKNDETTFTSLSLADVSTNSFIVTNLQNGLPYTISLVAINSVGDSEAAVSQPVTPATNPSSPTITNAIRGNQQIIIEFQTPNGNGSPITGYKYKKNNETTFTSLSLADVSTNSFIVTNLQNGLPYTISLVAINSVGDSEAAVSQPVIPATNPSSPTITNAIRGNQQITIEFQTPSNDGGSPITGYKYKKNNETTFTSLSLADVSTNSFIVTNLQNGLPYTISLVAINSVGDSEAAVSQSVTPASVPPPPTNIRGQINPTTATLSFDQTSNGGLPITNYKYSINDGSFNALNPADNISPVTIPGLTPESSFSIKLKAVNSLGDSIESTAFLASNSTKGWETTLGGIGDEKGIGTAADTMGNIYVIGSYTGNITLKTRVLNGLQMEYVDYGDISGSGSFLIKYNSLGTIEWVTTMGGTASKVTTDTFGNVYLIGHYTTTTLVPINSAAPQPSPLGSTLIPIEFGKLESTNIGLGTPDVLIIKYNSNGEVQWVTKTDGERTDVGKGIAVDSSGNVYVTGDFQSEQLTINNASSTVTNSIINVTEYGIIKHSSTNSLSGSNIFIIKYDILGQVLWATKCGTIGNITTQEEAYGIVVDLSNNICIIGTKSAAHQTTMYNFASHPNQSSDEISLTPYAVFPPSSPRPVRTILIKYNTNGQGLWLTGIGRTVPIGLGITTDNMGNIIITGKMSDTNTEIYSSVSPLTLGQQVSFSISGTFWTNGVEDVFVIKYNTSGTVIWGTRLGGTGEDIGYSVSTDIFGNVYVTGTYQSPNLTLYSYSSKYPGEPYTLTTYGKLTNSGSTDTFIVKYNENGIIQWATKITGVNTEVGNSITGDTLGNLYVTGYYSSSTTDIYNFRSAPTASTNEPGLDFYTTLISAGENDVFIIKYDPDGKIGIAPTAPSSPIITSAIGRNQKIIIEFQTPSNGGSPITGYKYAIDGSSNYVSLSLADVSMNSFIVPNLTNGTSYTISLIAINSVGDSVPSVSQPTIPVAVWIQRGADIDGEAAFDYSGRDVILSSDGSIIAIRAAYNDGVNGTDSGHVRVYEWNGSSWMQRGTDIDGEAAYDIFGISVALNSNGNILAIGAWDNDGVNGTDSGHVRVYEWNGSSWMQRGTDIDGEAAYDQSGRQVSLSSDGSILAIGAHGNDGNGSNSGHVRVYKWNTTTLAWEQRGSDIDGEAVGDRSGFSVSLNSDGTILAIGAYGNDGVNGTDSGHVRVWIWNGTSWVRRGADIDGEAAYNYSGWSVRLNSDGTILAIGAYGNSNSNGTNAGNVRVYKWNTTTLAWEQRGSDIDGEAVGDRSGFSVSLSSEGNIVAIAAYLNDGTSGNINDNRGHVRVFKWNDTSWEQLGTDIDGEANGDQSGQSVSLSSDGNILAIGAGDNDGVNGTDSGHVRVYELI